MNEACDLCSSDGGQIVYQEELFRIVLVDDPRYLAYLRVIANTHLKEVTDLAPADNLAIYQAVIKCEQILRKLCAPTKINLASLGNLTPHVHWHIIPRFSDDLHFPNPIWGALTNLNYQPSLNLRAAHQTLSQNFASLFTQV